MGAYQSLFNVSVSHQFFSDGLWKGLDFHAEPGTLKLAENTNTVIKKTANGIAAYYDTDKLNALHLYAKDAEGVLRFSFNVVAQDRSFANYTSLPPQREDALLYFSNRGEESAAGDGRTRLSKADFASEQDLTDMDGLVSKGFQYEPGRSVADFLVDIFIDPAKISAPEYAIDFAARQSYLKYYLMGNMNRSNLFIVDLDNRVEFEFCGDAVLPGSRPSKVFRSKGRIPILEKSGLRFQLKEQGQGSGKVLIKRLPVASGERLGMELIDGRREIVSESFINF